MMRTWSLRALLPVVFAVALAFTHSARAAGRSAVHVVNLDSDDATEDQAEGLTAALKSRVRATSGWQLAEGHDSLALLLPALKCPPKPDAPCLQRIPAQPKAVRFSWATLGKGPNAGQVTADLHLWVLGQPEQSLKSSYAENLKDPNDDALRKVASTLFERLAGNPTEGTVTIHCGVADAQVFVDGVAKGTIEHGAFAFSLAAGAHHIELRASGYATAAQDVNVVKGSESSVTIELGKSTSVTVPEAKEAGKPVRVVRLLGFGAIGAGIVVGAIGAVKGVEFLGLQSDNQNDASKYSAKVTDFCSDATKLQLGTSAPCVTRTAAEDARSLEFILIGSGAALIATGALMLAFQKPADDKPATALRVTPSFDPRGGSLSLGGAF